MIKSLSVVVPAYNEADNIAECIRNIDKVLKNLKLDSEIIVVDDGSKDKTGEIARSFIGKVKNLKVITNRPNRGYGGSLRSGFAASKKDFIAFIPGDNQFDFSEITVLLEKQAESNADIVSGIRVGGGVDPFLRKVNRFGWNFIIRLLFGFLVSDIDCGFKLLRRSILAQINLTAEKGAMIDTELFAGAKVRGFTFAEVPVTHLPRVAGAATGANFKVIIQSFLDLFSFWWRLQQELFKERDNSYKAWEWFFLGLIIVTALFVRIYRISEYMTFLGDEGRDAVIVRDIVVKGDLTLLGPGTSIGNMYLGPLYYYMMVPAMLLADMSPVGASVMVALLSVATLWLLWWWLRQFSNREAALWAALLYALSPAVIEYARSSWNPNVMPFFATTFVLSLWSAWRQNQHKWFVGAFASLAGVLQSHYLGLLLLPLLLFVGFIQSTTREFPKWFFIGFAVFVLLMSPLVAFDFRHNFLNFRNMTSFFTNRQTTVNFNAFNALSRFIPTVQKITTDTLAGKNESLGKWLPLGLLFGLFLVVKKEKITPELILLGIWLGAGILGLMLYKQHIYTHYFGFMFPGIFAFLALILSVLGKWKYLLIALLLGAMLIRSPLRYAPNRQLQKTEEIADFIVKQANGQNFNMALLAKSNYDKSYRFIFDKTHAKYKTLHEEVTGQLYVVCEQSDCNPINNPLWEIAAFGWAKIERQWDFPWGVKVFKLVRNIYGTP